MANGYVKRLHYPLYSYISPVSPSQKQNTHISKIKKITHTIHQIRPRQMSQQPPPPPRQSPSPPSSSSSPPESPTSPLNHPNIILQTARQFLSHRNFRRSRHFALQLPHQFPGADQILAVSNILAIAYETTIPNPFRILEVPDYTRNLSQIADQFKRFMDLVTDPNHSFPFADEAQAHLLRAYSKISKPNCPVKNVDDFNYYDDVDDDQERILIYNGGIIKNQERVLINKDDLIKNQERVLINEGGLIKNEERILINQSGLNKNQERILIQEEGGLTKVPDDEEIEAGVGTVVEGVDQEKKNDDDDGHMILDDQNDRDENPKRRKLDE